MKVYQDIKNRNIQWPPDHKVPDAAVDLINRMIQVEPEHRLGHDLESLKLLKTHPFFEGVDWTAVSSKEYKGIKQLVLDAIPEGKSIPQTDIDTRPSLGNVFGMSGNPLADENAVVLHGNLCKKNWYGRI